MTDEIKVQLEEIKKYTVLAAKKVLCIEDVAILTGLSKSHLYKLTCRREIPHYKPNGKCVYFDRQEVEAWMKQNRQSTNTEIEQLATNHVVLSRKGGRV